MQAFHNDAAVKQKYLSRIRAHQAADNLIRGTGWEDGKGCAVGCTLENYNHAQYPIELGVPEWLARVEDTLFEGMDEEKSRTWPEQFLDSIRVGADLEPVKAKFIVILLEHSLKSMQAVKFDRKKFPDVVSALDGSAKAVGQMIDAQKSGDQKLIEAARSAESVAWSAESAAWSAAKSAESAAWFAAKSAAWSAESAAWSAARSAESVAWSAESAAWSAAKSAESAAWFAESAAWFAESAAWSAAESAARSAARSAESAAHDYYADELLKLLREA